MIVCLRKANTRLQMTKYRARALAAAPAFPKPATSTASPESWQLLDKHYGLDDMFDDIATSKEQSVDEEYLAYIDAPLSKPGTDLLKFWEV